MGIAAHYALFLGGLCSAAAVLVYFGLYHLYSKSYLRLWIAAACGFLLHFVAELLVSARLFDPLVGGNALLLMASAVWSISHVLMLAGLFELRNHRPLPLRLIVGLSAIFVFIDLTVASLNAGSLHLALARADGFDGAIATIIGVYFLLRPAHRANAVYVIATGLMIAVAAGNLFRVIDGGMSEIVSVARAFSYGLLSLALLLLVFEDEHEASSLAASHVELLAYHDSLTGLPNRSLFFDRLVLSLAHAERYGHRVAVLFFDLDRFKQVNDSLGHAVGDALLKKVAERVQSFIRLGDTLARFGGDEFVLLVPRIDTPEQAVTIARKIVQSLHAPFDIAGRELSATSSAGVAIFPDDATDADSLIRNADAAMYRAKEHGRNQFELYSPSLSAAAMAKLELESGLRHALDHGELELFYQPLIDLKEHGITGMEALLRWQSPEYGLVSPERFIDAAEVSGLIVPIGDWVLREACRQTVVWQHEHGVELIVSVKLTPRQFTDRQLIEKLKTVLRETSLPSWCLELEITESCAMRDPEQTLVILQQLKGVGVRIALDDFGTGHSSLHYLQRFTIDTLKVDRRFIADVASRREGTIVKSMIDLAHSLGLTVVAEGVESESQLEFLGEQLCDVVQGYLFSAPLRAAELSNFIRQHKRLVGPTAGTWNVEKVAEASGRHVLVVDDDAAIRILVQKMLERARFTVDTARDGMEAFSKIRENHYVAVFLDIMMPRLDGFGVIDYLKRETPDLLRNVVVMTAISPAALQRVAAEPVARILPKPFDVAQVIASANECALRQRAS
jgi:diguanylate cyclase (GGDEF)-like protein